MPLTDTFAANPHWAPPPPRESLDAIPGDDGWPIIGNTFKMLADPVGFAKMMHGRFGEVYRNRAFGNRGVNLLGPDANELVLFDRDKVFSSEQGWGVVLNQLFPRGLMLMDFEKHRVHRKTISVAFKPEPMKLYAEALNEGIAARVAQWRAKGEFAFYPAVKSLTLDLAATSFLGLPWGPDADKINKAFVDMVQASIAVIRTPLPGTKMGRGVAGRAFLVDYFSKEVPKRRASDQQDIFSQICRATHEDGSLLTDDEIIDHMNFLMMAAHDTITSSATSMTMLLAQHPEWQEKLRTEMNGLGVNGDMLPYEKINDLVLTDYAFKESLRLVPPVPSLPRRAVKDFTFQGHVIKAGTMINVNPVFTHAMPEYWPEPETFDPMRFEPDAVRARHKYAWVPFGGGAHMCLGLHFAYMQMKILMWHMLKDGQISLAKAGKMDWKMWPIPQPKGGLPVRLERV